MMDYLITRRKEFFFRLEDGICEGFLGLGVTWNGLTQIVSNGNVKS